MASIGLVKVVTLTNWNLISIAITYTLSAYPPSPIDCPLQQFPCFDRQQCVGVDELCEGTAHCVDRSDEDPTLCDRGAYVCVCCVVL